MAVARERQTFPLVPLRRLTGLPFGDLPSRRRGHGVEIIGSRAYVPGDPVSTIDWFASARLSTATGGDEFVVRDRASDESPRVCLVVDRRPAMGLYPRPLPWLSKRLALREAVASVVASAVAARAEIGAVDFAGGEASWLPPARRDRPVQVAERLDGDPPFDAPEDNLDLALAVLGRHRTDLPAGSFTFVFSDFLAAPASESWLEALAHGWDLVPVVIQDPLWEQGFPDVSSAALPVSDPRTGRISVVRLGRRQAARLRERNALRLQRLLAELDSFGLRPVVLGSSDPFDIDRAFLQWAEERRRGRWAR